MIVNYNLNRLVKECPNKWMGIAQCFEGSYLARRWHSQDWQWHAETLFSIFKSRWTSKPLGPLISFLRRIHFWISHHTSQISNVSADLLYPVSSQCKWWMFFLLFLFSRKKRKCSSLFVNKHFLSVDIFFYWPQALPSVALSWSLQIVAYGCFHVNFKIRILSLSNGSGLQKISSEPCECDDISSMAWYSFLYFFFCYSFTFDFLLWNLNVLYSAVLYDSWMNALS